MFLACSHLFAVIFSMVKVGSLHILQYSTWKRTATVRVLCLPLCISGKKWSKELHELFTHRKYIKRMIVRVMLLWWWWWGCRNIIFYTLTTEVCENFVFYSFWAVAKRVVAENGITNIEARTLGVWTNTDNKQNKCLSNTNDHIRYLMTNLASSLSCNISNWIFSRLLEGRTLRLCDNFFASYVLQRMDFETIPLYNKIILGPATPTEVRNVTNKHILQ